MGIYFVYFVFVYLTLQFIKLSQSIKTGGVLIIHPVYGGSHIYTMRKIAMGIVARGHQCHVIRTREENDFTHLDNITETLLSVNNTNGKLTLFSKEEIARFNLPHKKVWENGLNPLQAMNYENFAASFAICEVLLQNNELLQMLKDRKFDIAIVDILANECGLALAHHLGLPVVGYWSFIFTSGETMFTTSMNLPSIVPNVYTVYTDHMTLWQRIINIYYLFGSYLIMECQFYGANKIIQKYLPNSPHPKYLIGNISGMLINSNPAFTYPRHMPPTFIEVGGLQIGQPKPLPKDIEQFLANSKQGAIIFTLGLNFDSIHMDGYTFNKFFRAFGRLKQNVLVKTKGTPTYTPPNVKILPYLPQQDVLAHENTVLFITHCGMHGVFEAIKFRVPMVGIPFFIDQMDNMRLIEDKGIGYALHTKSTEDEIVEAIEIVLRNKSYQQNIEKVADMVDGIYPKSPLERSLDLIEYMIIFKGAEQLKLSSRHLNVLQLLSVDVLLITLVMLILISYIVTKTFVFFCKSLKSKSVHNKLKIS